AVEILRKQNKEAQDKAASRETAEGRIGVYVDPANKVGAIVELRCESAPVAKNEMFVKLANEVAKQVALKGATTPEELLAPPLVAVEADLPRERVEKEREIAAEQVKADPKNASKPANILEKIVEGKVRSWMAENVLNDQPFVKDESKTIGQLLAGAGLKLKR